MRIYLDTTIQELFDGKQISARTYNCLRYAGMVTHNWKLDRKDRFGLLLVACRDTIGNVTVREVVE